MSSTGEFVAMSKVRESAWRLLGKIVLALGAWVIITATVVFVAIIEGNAIKDATIIALKEVLVKLDKRDDSSAIDREAIHARLERLEKAVKTGDYP